MQFRQMSEASGRADEGLPRPPLFACYYWFRPNARARLERAVDTSDGKWSAGHRPQATAPILDSTDAEVHGAAAFLPESEGPLRCVGLTQGAHKRDPPLPPGLIQLITDCRNDRRTDALRGRARCCGEPCQMPKQLERHSPLEDPCEISF